MEDHILIESAEGFRDGILDGGCSINKCFMVSSPLQAWLLFMGVTCELVSIESETGNHFFIELPDGRVLDATADQFDATLPAVYLGRALAIHLED